MSTLIECENCINYYYDDEYEEYCCGISMDEDEYYRINFSQKAVCPYFRQGDEYTIVR